MSNLEIHLGTTLGCQEILRVTEKLSAESGATAGSIDSQQIEPPPTTFVTNHDGSHNLAVFHSDKQIPVKGHLSFDHRVGYLWIVNEFTVTP